MQFFRLAFFAAAVVPLVSSCSDPAPATTAATADVAADSTADAAVTDTAKPDAATADARAPDAAPVDATSPDAALADQTQADATATDSQDGAALADAAGSCPAPQPPGTVCQGTVWVCGPGFFKPYGVASCVEATCDNLQAAVSTAIEAATGAAQSCAAGEECVVVPTSTACQGSCGVAVAADRQNDVLKVVGWLDDNICKPFDYAQKCGYSTPKCMAPNPICKAGVCAYMP